jgi:hypothetical protein
VLAGAALFPILWAIGSAHHLGHPLQFLRNQARVAEFYMGQLGRENAALSNFIAHPRELARQAGILIPLLAGLGLVGITRMPGARPVVIVATYVAALILIMSLVSIKAGYGAPPRSLTIVYSMTLVLAALVFQVVERGLFGGARVGRTARLAARASTALFAVGWLGFNGLMAHRYETYGDDVRHDTLALGAWLQQEIRRPQFMAELGPETRIGVYSERAAGETIALIGYLASRPGNIRAISPEQAESNDFAEFDCVLYDGDPGVANLNPVIQIGNWRVFDR